MLSALLAMVSDSGIISGTIANNAESIFAYSIIVTATDLSSDASTYQSFNWTVNPPEITLSGPGGQTNHAGDSVYLDLSAWTSDGASLIFYAQGLPAGRTIDEETGIISGTIAGDAGSTTPYSVTVSAIEDISETTATQRFQWTVNPPVVTLSQPSDQTNTAGSAVYLPLSATDNNGIDLTSYSATGLPPGLNIDSNSGLISGTLDLGADMTSPYFVTVSAGDAMGNVSPSQTFTWTVNPSTVVSLSAPGDQVHLAGETVSLAVYATDSHGSDLTFTADGIPPGLSIDSIGSNPATVVISGTLDADADRPDPYVVTRSEE